MTNRNYTDVTILLDRSGSMVKIQNDVVGGYQTFVKEQRQLPGECKLTLVQFDSIATDTVVDAQPINRVTSKLKFKPRGNTPLLDALGQTITKTGGRFAALPEEQRPGKVVFVIITDGEENASWLFAKETIKSIIERQQQIYSWEFIYLGANVDAFAEAANIGIKWTYTSNYDFNRKGLMNAFATVSNSVSNARYGQTAAITDDDREKLTTTGDNV